MYMQHELREVAEYRQTEALERIHTLHSLMKGNPGFIRTLACRYLGRTDQYAWMRMWESAAAQTAFRQTDPARDFAKTRPEGLYQPLPGGIGPGLNWESIVESGGRQSGTFLVRQVFKVAPGREDEFVERRRRHDELAQKFPGIGPSLTFRSADADSLDLYLTLTRSTDRKTYDGFLESTLAASYRESLPVGLCAALVTECYEIVEELTAES
jgi:heme-degrading monooxygenase HmoA